MEHVIIFICERVTQHSVGCDNIHTYYYTKLNRIRTESETVVLQQGCTIRLFRRLFNADVI
jgi:hypothetical protein